MSQGKSILICCKQPLNEIVHILGFAKKQFAVNQDNFADKIYFSILSSDGPSLDEHFRGLENG